MKDDNDERRPAPPSFFTCGPHNKCPSIERCVIAQRCIGMDTLRKPTEMNGSDASIT